MEVVYTSAAEEDLALLQPSIAERIVRKMQWYLAQDDPLHFALPLQGRAGFYRFRIGGYRVIFTLQKHIVVILVIHAIKHRSEAYR